MNAASRVSLPQVARVLSEVYGDRMAAQNGGSDGESFPLQQKLLVCCLLLLIRNGKSKEILLGKVRRRPVLQTGHFQLIFKCWSLPYGADETISCVSCISAPRGVQSSVRSEAGVSRRSGRVLVSLQSAGESGNLCSEEGQRGSTHQGTQAEKHVFSHVLRHDDGQRVQRRVQASKVNTCVMELRACCCWY